MKRFILDKEQRGKLFLIGTTLLVWSVILVLFNVYGYQETWKIWRVPTAKDVFLDFQLIPGSAESFRNGFEPTVENPNDPTGRIFNYPAFWRLFFYSGITREDTVWIGICMNVLFFVGVFLFPKKISILGAVGMLFVIFSPAAMLLYERGNVDLIVFFICVLIILAESYSGYAAALLIAFGSIVKLFPFFGVSVLLKESKNKFWLLFISCFLFLAAYMISISNSVNAAWNLTVRGNEISYGTNVFITRYGQLLSDVFARWFSSPQIDLLLRYGPLAAGCVLVLMVAIFAFMNKEHSEIFSGANLDAFRVGASVYVGTFLLGNNWDYRLTFLVLVVPQLVEWAWVSKKRIGFVAINCLIAMYISCWHFIAWYSPVINSTPDRVKALFIFDEMTNWMLLAGLSYLLIASTPAWLKNQLGSILPNRNSSPSTQP